jgi:uncharacterized protein (DUF2342 family)
VVEASVEKTPVVETAIEEKAVEEAASEVVAETVVEAPVEEKAPEVVAETVVTAKVEKTQPALSIVKGHASAPTTKPPAAEVVTSAVEVTAMPNEQRVTFQKSERNISTLGATSRASSETTLAKA